MPLLIAFSLSACFAEGGEFVKSDTAKCGESTQVDCISTESTIQPPLSDGASAKIQRDKSEKYNAKLAASPIYSSDIRSELIKNSSSYRQTYRPVLDYFVGLAPRFKCIHSERMIGMAQKDGWQLVKCDEDRAVFFKRNESQKTLCDDIPSIADLYDTLIVYPIDSKSNSVVTDHSKLQLGLRGKLVRPTKDQVPFSHKMVVKYLGSYSGSENDLIPEVGYVHSDEIRFFEPKKYQVVTFFSGKNNNNCKRNPIGRRYAEKGWIELDADVQYYSTMSAELEKYVVYVR